MIVEEYETLSVVSKKVALMSKADLGFLLAQLGKISIMPTSFYQDLAYILLQAWVKERYQFRIGDL